MKKFDEITIFGLGLIGGSLAGAFKRARITARINGVDRQPVLEKALNRGWIDAAFEIENFGSAIANSDLIILAAPISAITDILKPLSERVRAGTLVTDVGSTKQRVVETARAFLPEGVYFLGGHPMAGSEKSGIDHADPLLFENSVYVLTESEQIPPPTLAAFLKLLEFVGARPLFLSAKQHDEIAAVVSHLPQLLAVTLMQYVAKKNTQDPTYFCLAAGGFRDLTRIASSGYPMWQDILASNCENIDRVLSDFQMELTEIKQLLAKERLRPTFEQAAENRQRLPVDSRGFVNPHFDVSVQVEDCPGVIAEISGALAAAKINIKDIEILKIREGEAGTMRLAFESRPERALAIEILTQIGYKAVPRD